MSDSERQVEAEEIVRAFNRLVMAMYDGDLEAGWPREAHTLQAAYEERYSVDLNGGAYD